MRLVALHAVLVFQAFDMPFDEVRARLPELQERGYTHVQVSPPQKSIPRSEWWARYQPVDYSKIEGPLGNETQFARMTAEASRLGVRILVDAVLNHMAGTGDYPTLEFPQFGPQHFHFSRRRPCITDWEDRFQVTQHWLCGPGRGWRFWRNRSKLPDLDTSQDHVRQTHLSYLRRLLELGASGFRFDAAKHIEPEYFEWLMPRLGEMDFSYGEVIGTSLEESGEYTDLFRVTDFHLLGKLIETFSRGPLTPLLELDEHILPPERAIIFARNHDTAMHSDFFNFPSLTEARLASVLLLAWGRGIPVVYRDEDEDLAIRSAIRFRRALAEEDSDLLPAEDPELLLVRRGSRGMGLIHNGAEWLHAPKQTLPGLAPGCYRELNYGFEVEVGSQGQVLRWDRPGQTGISVGPKTSLLLLPC